MYLWEHVVEDKNVGTLFLEDLQFELLPTECVTDLD